MATTADKMTKEILTTNWAALTQETIAVSLVRRTHLATEDTKIATLGDQNLVDFKRWLQRNLPPDLLCILQLNASRRKYNQKLKQQ